jgi:hypothetical protein
MRTYRGMGLVCDVFNNGNIQGLGKCWYRSCSLLNNG